MNGLSPARAIALVAAGWLGLGLGAPLAPPLPRAVPPPDPVLLVVLFVGVSVRGGVAGTTALALALGYLADLFSGAPKGVHMIAYAVVALAVRGASSRLLVRGLLYTAFVAAFFCAAFG